MKYNQDQIKDFHDRKFAFLEIGEENHVLTITLNRPDKRNAFHPPLLNELAYALAYAHYSPSVWVVVLCANGPVFCAGADLKAFAGMGADAMGSTIPEPDGQIVLGDEFKGLHKPCIAKVHGDVHAGGFLMLGGCTHVVASDRANFSLPEVKRGIWPMQVMASLIPIMNPRDMLDLCMRGRTLSAKEALEYRLVTSLVEHDGLDEAVGALVSDLLEQSPTAIRLGLQAYHELESVSKEQEHQFLHGMLMKVLQTKDAREGLTAFREKRKPEWTGE